MLVDLWTDDDNVLAEKENVRALNRPKVCCCSQKYRSRDFPGSRCPVIVLVSKKRATGSRTMDSLVVQRLCYSLQRMYNVRRKKKVGKDLCEAICWLCVQGFSGMWILDELLIRTQHAMRPLSSFDLALFL